MDGSRPPPVVPCPRCGAELCLGLQGGPLQCARCWFAAARTDSGKRIGGYQLITELGEGGSGIVYLAREVASDRLVALKVAKPEARHAQVAFREEIKNVSRLTHRHIVRVLAADDSEGGEAFLAMELMENGTLAEAVKIGKYREHRAILGLMLKLAQALQHAHQHAVLHCDLKPENILFDAEQEPHVGDFGLAQSIEGTAGPEMLGGTRGWMSPEQARRKLSSEAGERQEALTVASDVFSLGAVLHWLLTRELPFGNDSDFEQRVQFEEAPSAVPYRRWSSGLDWEISVICQTAMAKDPANRYRSAADLADDVERALAGLPISAEHSLPVRRLAKWVRRHKLLAVAGVLLVLLLLYLPLVPFLVLGESRNVLIEQNSNAALHQAGAFMNELRSFADWLHAIADEEDVRRLVEYRDLLTPPAALSRHGADDIANLSVFSLDGTMRARWPKVTTIPATSNFAFRDYFRGAMNLGREGLRQVYVARVVRSRLTDQMALELSTPMFGKNAEVVGIFVASRRVSSTFGAVQMNCAGAGSCMTGLLGPRDRDSAEATLPSAISVVAAPGLERGADIAWDLTLGRKICKELGCVPAPRDQFRARTSSHPIVEDYVDPISLIPSIGAFAPVGSTGLVVVVATPHSAVRGLTDRMLGKARSYLGVPLLLGLALFAGLLASLHLHRPGLARQRSGPS